MPDLLKILLPEIILATMACALFLLGCVKNPTTRRTSGILALGALLLAFMIEVSAQTVYVDSVKSLKIDFFSHVFRLISLAMASVLCLLGFPTNADSTGNSAMHYGSDAGEFFGFMLLSVAGLTLLSAANDLIMFFLALELISIPTYIMVSMSRLSPLAQEAGLKYFYLGALSAAGLLLGFSYLFGATGSISFPDIQARLMSGVSPMALFGCVLIILALAFKMSAFPMHFYVGDVYEGAATPVTAFLAFVPKAGGLFGVIKLLYLMGGDHFAVPMQVQKLLWVLAICTMSIGNALALMQSNVKRLLAYSSVAHSGYLLVGVVSLAGAPAEALHGVLFYLMAYGLMNIAVFGALMLLPSRDGAGSAETFEDIAGQGRAYLPIGLAVAVACFSLIGLPLTIGFVGKIFLIKPALLSHNIALVIVLILNAAVSAAYYLRIVGNLFMRAPGYPDLDKHKFPVPIAFAVILAVIGTLALGSIPQATDKAGQFIAEWAVLSPAASVQK